MQSKIFTQAELKEIERRKKGDKSDKTGIFSGRIKPKIIEIFEWFKKKKELKKLIEPSSPRRKSGKGTGG